MTLHVRVTNKAYSEATGDAGILRPAYQESAIGLAQPAIYAVIVLGAVLAALSIRALVMDARLRRALKNEEE